MSGIFALGLLLTAPAEAAVCADDTVGELEATMTDVLEAHKLVDELAFERAGKLMDAALTCLDTPPGAGALARVHHVMALRSFVNGQTRATKRALAALRLVDPGWSPPFPQGHPFTDLWFTSTDPGPVESVGSIAPRAWVIDAIARDEVPIERAFLLQVRDDDGSIRLTRYLFDAADLPDLGQDREVDRNATPWTVSVQLRGWGRRRGQRQQAEAAGLAEQQASGLSAGGGVVARVTPTAVFGGEVALGASQGDDVIGGGGTGVEGRLVGLLGSGLTTVGSGTLFAAGRLGIVTDTARAWPGSATQVAPGAWQLVGPSLGAEVGIRGREAQATLTLDGALAGAAVPWLVDLRLDGTHLLNETVGLCGGLGVRSMSQPLLDGETVAGKAGSTDLRLSFGVDLVF